MSTINHQELREPETPEEMQQELLQRIDNVFDFFLNQ